MKDNTLANPNSFINYTFEEFRDYTLIVTSLLHGDCSTEHQSVVEAWIAVGLLDCATTPISVTLETIDGTDPCNKDLTANVANGSHCYSYIWFKEVGGNWQQITGQTGAIIPVTCNTRYKVEGAHLILSHNFFYNMFDC